MFRTIRILATLIAFSLLFHQAQAGGYNAVINPALAALYPGTYDSNLAESLFRIVNTNGQFYENGANTITYEAVPTTLDFGPIAINSTTGGSLSIYYNASTITKPSDCTLLPQILITSNFPQNYPGFSQLPSPYNEITKSVIAVSGLSEFSLYGVSIQLINDGNNILFNATTTVTFTNICINDTDPSSSPSQSSITFGAIASLAITNWIYNRTSTTTITMGGPVQVNIQNFLIQFDGTNPTPMMLMESVGTASIQGFTASCMSSNVLLTPSILTVINSAGITVSNFSYENCNLNNSANHDLQHLFGSFLITNVTEVNFTGITISNVVIYLTASGTPPPLISMDNVTISALIQDYSGVCTLGTNNVFMPYLLVAETINNITVSNFSISNCNYSTSANDPLAGYYGNIVISSTKTLTMSAINVSNFLLSPSLFSSPSPMITLDVITSSATITGLSLTCSPTAILYTPIILAAISVGQTIFNSFSISSCKFIDSEVYTVGSLEVSGLILVSNTVSFTSSLSINGITVTSVSFSPYEFFTPPSMIAIDGIVTVTIQGINAVCTSSLTPLYIPSVLTALTISSLTVSNVTVANCNPSGLGLPKYSNYSGNFIVSTVLTVAFTNISINNFVLSPTSTTSYVPIFVLSSVLETASFTGLSMSCNYANPVATPILLAVASSPALQLTITNFALSSCNFVDSEVYTVSGLTVSSLFLVSSITSLSVNGVTITSTAFTASLFQTAPSVFLLEGIAGAVTIENFSGVCSSSTTPLYIPSVLTLVGATGGLTVSNVTIASCDPSSAGLTKYANYSGNFIVSSVPTVAFTNISINNFVLSPNSTTSYVPIFVLSNVTKTASFTGLSMSCNYATPVATPILLAVASSLALQLTITTFSLSSCNFVDSEVYTVSGLTVSSLFLISTITSMSVNGVTITSTAFTASLFQTAPSVFLLEGIAGAVTIENFSGVCSSSTTPLYIPSVLTLVGATGGLNVSNVTIASCDPSSAGLTKYANYSGNFIVSSVPTVAFTNISVENFVLSPTSTTSYSPIFVLSSVASNASFTGLSMTCNPLVPVATPILLAIASSPALKLSITTFTLSNCSFVDSEVFILNGDAITSLFLISSITSLNVSGVTVSSTVFTSNLSQIAPSMFTLEGINTVNIQGFSGTCTSSASPLYIPSVLQALDITTSLTISNFSITYCSTNSNGLAVYSNYSGNFIVNSVPAVSFTNISINNFFLSPTSKTNYLPIFYLSDIASSSSLTSTATFTNLVFSGVPSTSLLTPILLAALISPTLQLSITNVTLSNCNFTDSEFLSVEGITANSLFLIYTIDSLTVSGFTAKSVSIASGQLALGTPPSLFLIEGVISTVTIQGFLGGCASSTNPLYIPSMLTVLNVGAILAVNDVTITYCGTSSIKLYSNYSGNFIVDSVPVVSFSNISINNFALSPTSLTSYIPVFFLSNIDSAESIFSIAIFSGLSLACVPFTPVATPILLATVTSPTLQMQITNVTISSCSFFDSEAVSVSGTPADSLFLISTITSLSVIGFTVTSTTFSSDQLQMPPSIFLMQGITSAITIQGFYGVCTSDINPLYIPLLVEAEGTDTTTLTISNLTIANCDLTNLASQGLNMYSGYIGNFLILNIPTVSLDQININNFVLSPSVNVSAIPVISLVEGINTVTISSLSLTCNPNIFILSPILLAAAQLPNLAITISNFALANCNFIGSQIQFESGAYGNIVVDEISSLTATGVTITNLNLALINSSDIVNTSNPYSTFTIVDTYVTTIQNVVVSNLTLESFPQNTSGFSIIAHAFENLLTPEPVSVINNFQLLNSNITGAVAAIAFSQNSDSDNLGNITVSQVTITNTFFNNTNFLAFSLAGHSSNVSVTDLQQFNFAGFTVTNSNFQDTRLLIYVEIDTDLTVYANESQRLNFTNLIFTNNILNASSDISVIEVIGCQVTVTNLQVVKNNSIIGTSFFSNSLRMASFFLSNTVFDSNTLSSSAYFVGYLLDKTLYRVLEAQYTNSSNLTQRAETRPFMMINCTFNNIVLSDDSTLFVSNNPMIIIGNNTFTNIISDSSVVASFQKYSPAVPLPNGYTYMPYYQVESEVFTNLAYFYTLFVNTRNTLNQSSVSQVVFFLMLQNNTFSNISSLSGTSLIEIAGLSLPSTYISITSNIFIDSSIDTTNTFSILDISDIIQLAMITNSFTRYVGTGNVMSITSSSAIEQLFISSNYYQSINNTASYDIQAAICNNVTIENDTVSSCNASSSWMQIDCSLSNGNITINNSHYSNLNVFSSPGRLLALNFLLINIQQAQSGASNVIIKPLTSRRPL